MGVRVERNTRVLENFSKIMNEVLGDLVVLRMKLYIAKGE